MYKIENDSGWWLLKPQQVPFFCLSSSPTVYPVPSHISTLIFPGTRDLLHNQRLESSSSSSWYKLNAETRIPVKICVGDTAEKKILDSIGQDDISKVNDNLDQGEHPRNIKRKKEKAHK